MAHHQRSAYDRAHAALTPFSSSGLQSAGDSSITGDEDSAEVDEPPDNRLKFARIAMPPRARSVSENGALPSPRFLKTRNASLLTQALLSGSDHTSGSDAEAPVLTSDGGLTSPNTPSPPPPTASTLDFGPLGSRDMPTLKMEADRASSPPSTAEITPRASHETSLEDGLRQRRCITFACGRQDAPPKETESAEHSRNELNDKVKSADPPKRPCMLRFACPSKASVDVVRAEPSQKVGPSKPMPKASLAIHSSEPNNRRDSGSGLPTLKESLQEDTAKLDEAHLSVDPPAKRHKLSRSEATRFHAFGGSFGDEEEWTKEEIKDLQKLTVNDTLRMENAIRKLGQEAEEEAIEEDEEEEEEEEDEDDETCNGIGEFDSDENISDGNETDNEEGFADSDDDSDMDSNYQFWTPGLTTAATSTDHVEHIRPLTRRVASDSSIESTIKIRERRSSQGISSGRISRSRSLAKAEKMRPGTPDLPDSTDFVCGTLDEDRPLEAAYVSCLEERKRAKHGILPQDIDPSFPTSDPEMDEEGGDEEDDAILRSSDGSDAWVAGRPDDSDSGDLPRPKRPLARKAGKSPMPSPKRMRSPPPPSKRTTTHRSPPPRRLFGQSPGTKMAPLRADHELKSPLSTRMTTPSASPRREMSKITAARLAQRPHLTHTASLPRTPNPFWSKHRRYLDYLDDKAAGSSPTGHETHSRGPIDIVKGLENKRQRRKENFWRQQYRTAGKEKERRCQPGAGAARMKEVGLEMAEKCRGYGAKAQVVLSV